MTVWNDRFSPLVRAALDRFEWKTIDALRQRLILQNIAAVKRQFVREGTAAVKAALASKTTASIETAVNKAIDGQRKNWARTIGDEIYQRSGGILAERTFRSLNAKSVILDIDTKQTAVEDPPTIEEARPQWVASIDAYLKEEMAEKIKEIADTSKKKIGKIISKGLEDGDSVQTMARNIRAKYKSFSVSRAITIARTETIQASNLGSQSGAEATGLPLLKQWLSTLDSRTRRRPRDKFDHRAVNGQRRKLDKTYKVSGQALKFPGDTSKGASAGNTINCRCTEIYLPDKSAA